MSFKKLLNYYWTGIDYKYLLPFIVKLFNDVLSTNVTDVFLSTIKLPLPIILDVDKLLILYITSA